MGIINVDNMNFDNSYSDLASAVDAAQDHDEIRLFKDITIDGHISFRNKHLLINGNHHKVTVKPQQSSTNGYALVLYSGSLKLIDLGVLVEGNDIFILQVENIQNQLVLDHVKVIRRHQDDKSKFVPAISSVHYKKIDGQAYMSPLQITELHNCTLDYVRLIANQLKVQSTSIYGKQYKSRLIGNQVEIVNSLINAAYISSIQTDNSINMTNIISLGALTISGNMKLDGFKLLSPDPSSKNSGAALTITANRLYEYEHTFAKKSHASISQLEILDQNEDGFPAWFQVEKADLTFNNTVVPETISAPNLVDSGSIHFNNTQNLSRWKQVASNDQPTPDNENQSAKSVDQASTSQSDEPDSDAAIVELHKLVGLASVKRQVKEFVDTFNNNLRRQKKGLKVNPISMNMLFEGNPGTGKTVVARLVGKALFNKGILKGRKQSDGTRVAKFKEVQVQDLVDSVIGGTAIKTDEAVKSALDGVLFIDEAYTLAPVDSGSNGDIFKNEAVDTLIAQMENNRERLVVIMAGYTKPMEAFMKNGNPGLSSRFTNKIIFPDYSPDELIQILKLSFQNNDYVSDSDAFSLLADQIRKVYPYKGATGNARFIRNVFEDLIKQQSTRLAPLEDAQLSVDDMKTITIEDVKNAIKHSEHLKIDETDANNHDAQKPASQPHSNPVAKAASNNDPRNEVIKKSKVQILVALYKYHQIMDDLDADYDVRTDAVLEIISLKSHLENQLSSFDTNEVNQAKLSLPFFEPFDSHVNYNRLNQQLEQFNDGQQGGD